jgi:hypothetical protein
VAVSKIPNDILAVVQDGEAVVAKQILGLSLTDHDFGWHKISPKKSRSEETF